MTIDNEAPLRAVIYARISRDSEGEGQGVSRQVEDCKGLIAQRGWELTEVYVDNDISAAGSGKVRPRYQAMLEDARAKCLDVIVAYSNSRLTRRMLETVELMALNKKAGIKIVTVASGENDMATADGRAITLTLAAWDAAEAERVSERLTRQKAQRALQGLPQGGRYRVFGYSRDWEVIDDEAKVVREIFVRTRDGDSASAIARDLTARGLVTTSGKPWKSASVCHLLDNALYAGQRTYRGEIIGPSAIESIVGAVVWAEAQETRNRVIRPQSDWLISGIARCGRCQGSLTGHSAKKRYRCQSENGCGRVGLKKETLEDTVVSLMLAREGIQDRAKPTPDALLGKWSTVAAIDAEIDQAKDLFRANELELVDYTFVLKVLNKKRRELEKALTERQADPMSGPLVTMIKWHHMSLDERQGALMKRLDSVIVAPQEGRSSVFDPSRLTVRWRDGTTQQVTQEALEAIPQRDSANQRWLYPEDTAHARLGLGDRL